jgi:hypothetical protein
MHLLLLLQQDRLYLRLLVRGQAVALGQTRQFFFGVVHLVAHR